MRELTGSSRAMMESGSSTDTGREIAGDSNTITAGIGTATGISVATTVTAIVAATVIATATEIPHTGNQAVRLAL